VFEFGQLLDLVGMALLASLFTGEHRVARGNLSQGLTAIPAILPERRGGLELARGGVNHDDADHKQEEPEDLRGHV
jgi:hypothetical protein